MRCTFQDIVKIYEMGIDQLGIEEFEIWFLTPIDEYSTTPADFLYNGKMIETIKLLKSNSHLNQ